jgi:DNA-binding PadR family transcriptional regulator
VWFDDLNKESLIEQDRPEHSDGRIFFRLTAEGRARAAM